MALSRDELTPDEQTMADFRLSTTVRLSGGQGFDSEIMLTEADLRMMWGYCENDFGRFVRLLRFITSLGGPPTD